MKVLIEISDRDVKEFLDWANQRAFCNSGQHIVDRIATIFETSTPPDPQHGREPDKVKPLAQYLAEYIAYENIDSMVIGQVWRELLEQALDAYESTENVTIKIERV